MAAPTLHTTSPVLFLWPHLLFCPHQVILIHSRPALADVELLPSVRQEVKEILLRKGVRLLLGMSFTMPLNAYKASPAVLFLTFFGYTWLP